MASIMRGGCYGFWADICAGAPVNLSFSESGHAASAPSRVTEIQFEGVRLVRVDGFGVPVVTDISDNQGASLPSKLGDQPLR